MNYFRLHAFAVAVVKEDRSFVLSQMNALTGEAKCISCEKRADTEKSRIATNAWDERERGGKERGI